MELTFNNWSLFLDLDGGRIQELTHKGIKVFGTYHRIDGKIGNTHICAPSFDKEGQEKFGLAFHGYARTLQWKVEKQTADTIIISTITLSSKTYPASLKISQEFSLNEHFIHTVSLSHLSGKAVPINIGVHYYWDTPKGWGKSSLNDEPLSTNIKTNGYMNLKKINTVVFPHTTYELTSNGFRSAVLWTSLKIDGQENKLFSNDFCCIEPVLEWPHFFGSEQSILHPSETISASIRIRKVV